ncbi:MAG: AAA family ATPase [Candidatus Micrarchaeota archaeon]|nr:AAA family ATPase [Candidatus Micrarchaeota archaeon]
MRILITGCPGTGKTSLANKLIELASDSDKIAVKNRETKNLLKKFSLKIISLNDIADEFSLYEFYDNLTESKVVNLEALERVTNTVLDVEEDNFKSKKKKKKNSKELLIVVEGHLGAEIRIRKISKVFVLRTNPKELEKRLLEKGYGKKKLSENINAELVDYFTIKSEKLYGRDRVIELDTSSKSVNALAEKLIKHLKNQKNRKTKKTKSISWANVFNTEIEFVKKHLL